MKILFFAINLVSGGMERRLLELIKYLKRDPSYQISLVLTEDEIYYKYANDLDITIEIIPRNYTRYDPTLFSRFYHYCKQFKPDIIHAWSGMTTFYAIPAKLLCRVPLIGNIVANAKGNPGVLSINRFFQGVNIYFANAILSNSLVGLQAYKINSPKARVIRNGVHLERFHENIDESDVRSSLKVSTDYMVVMVACFTKSKDYDLFLDIAKRIGKIRDDVTFVGVGDGPELGRIQGRVEDEQIINVLLTGDQDKVEPIIASSDIGLLCTFSEGISNSIIEYMALGKPVIATDLNGGSKEIIVEGETGFCTARNSETVVGLLNLLFDDEILRISMGEKGRERISTHFSIERMGDDFEKLYQEVLAYKMKPSNRRS